MYLQFETSSKKVKPFAARIDSGASLGPERLTNVLKMGFTSSLAFE